MKFLLTAFAICLISFVSLKAQELKVSPDVNYKKITTGFKTPLSETKCKGLFNEPTVDLKWKPILKKVQTENDDFDDKKLETLKQENDIIKTEFEKNINIKDEPITRFVTPVVGVNYLGNVNNGCPPDNSIAISNGGYIVATANSTIEYDDMSGNNLYYKDFNGANGFFANASYTSVCDANVIYDAGADRFIMIAQNGGSSSTSIVLMCFSLSNNPLDGWWIYSFSGNPLGDASWFDFPSIGVSNNELYVSGNLFYDAGGFNQTCLFQMTKNVGYTGGTFNATNSAVWSGINDGNGNPSFTLVPAQGGQSSNYGPGVYLVSNDRLGGSTLSLYDLTDDITGSPVINAYSISTDAYAMGSNAYQLGSTDRLDIRDLRMQSAFYLNGIVHCVFHSKDPSSPYQVINYNRITVSNSTNLSSVFGLSGYDYTYPTIASYATSGTDKSVMIDFLRSGSSIYPEVRVVNCDNAMNWSGSTQVKAGLAPVTNCYQGSISANRWGDYTGISRKHNSATPSVWLSAQYGTSANDWLTWIAEIHSALPLAPVANFSGSPTTGTAPHIVAFNDLSTNTPTGWTWTFTGGSPTSSTSQNPTVTYNNVGNYNVKLVASNTGGSDTEQKNNYIHVTANTGIENIVESNSTKIFPNPISEIFTINFTLSVNTKLNICVVDVNGKLVKELYNGEGSEGENIFSFNKSNLTQGIYFLTIKNENTILKNEKIIIN